MPLRVIRALQAQSELCSDVKDLEVLPILLQSDHIQVLLPRGSVRNTVRSARTAILPVRCLPPELSLSVVLAP